MIWKAIIEDNYMQYIKIMVMWVLVGEGLPF